MGGGGGDLSLLVEVGLRVDGGDWKQQEHRIIKQFRRVTRAAKKVTNGEFKGKNTGQNASLDGAV